MKKNNGLKKYIPIVYTLFFSILISYTTTGYANASSFKFTDILKVSTKYKRGYKISTPGFLKGSKSEILTINEFPNTSPKKITIRSSTYAYDTVDFDNRKINNPMRTTFKAYDENGREYKGIQSALKEVDINEVDVGHGKDKRSKYPCRYTYAFEDTVDIYKFKKFSFQMFNKKNAQSDFSDSNEAEIMAFNREMPRLKFKITPDKKYLKIINTHDKDIEITSITKIKNKNSSGVIIPKNPNRIKIEAETTFDLEIKADETKISKKQPNNDIEPGKIEITYKVKYGDYDYYDTFTSTIEICITETIECESCQEFPSTVNSGENIEFRMDPNVATETPAGTPMAISCFITNNSDREKSFEIIKNPESSSLIRDYSAELNREGKMESGDTYQIRYFVYSNKEENIKDSLKIRINGKEHSFPLIAEIEEREDYLELMSISEVTATGEKPRLSTTDITTEIDKNTQELTLKYKVVNFGNNIQINKIRVYSSNKHIDKLFTVTPEKHYLRSADELEITVTFDHQQARKNKVYNNGALNRTLRIEYTYKKRMFSNLFSTKETDTIEVPVLIKVKN